MVAPTVRYIFVVLFTGEDALCNRYDFGSSRRRPLPARWRFSFRQQTEVQFVTVTTFITSQSACASSSPRGEPLSIIVLKTREEQAPPLPPHFSLFTFLSIPYRQREQPMFRRHKTKIFMSFFTIKKKHAVASCPRVSTSLLNLNLEREYCYRLQYPKLS